MPDVAFLLLVQNDQNQELQTRLQLQWNVWYERELLDLLIVHWAELGMASDLSGFLEQATASAFYWYQEKAFSNAASEWWLQFTSMRLVVGVAEGQEIRPVAVIHVTEGTYVIE